MRRQLFFPLLGLFALIVLSLTILVGTPRVREVFPAHRAVRVLANEPFVLSFSRAMQRDSVEERLTLEPPILGVYTWQGNTLTFIPDQPWPRGSTITVRLNAGSRSDLFIPFLNDQVWSFTIDRQLIAYLWPADGPADIYTLDPVSGETGRLTIMDSGVLGFYISSDGLRIFYSVRTSNQNSGTNSTIMLLDRTSGEVSQVLVCDNALCDTPRISPDGKNLAYERTSLTGNNPSSPTRVRLFSLSGGNTSLAGTPAHHTHSPVWSPGGLLTFYDRDQLSYIVLDLATSSSVMIPNDTGTWGTWSSDDDYYVFSEISYRGDQGATSHLLRFGRRTSTTIDLSQDDELEDTNPAFSPNGAHIAFARKYLDLDRWTPGRQLWLMEPGGSNASPLTDDPNFNHSSFAWSHDSQQLAYVRYNQTTLTDQPEIWLINVDGTDAVRLVIGGYAPGWIR